jgi:hypothetical protein
MTELLEHAVETLRGLPPSVQDLIAQMVLETVGEHGLADLSPEDEAAVLRSRAAAERGEFATDAQMDALWAKFDL